MIKDIFIVILIFPQIWCFSQVSNFEEYNKYYDSATVPDRENALKSGFKALEIAKILKNDSLTARANTIISYNYRDLGNLTSALNFALKAKPYYLKSSDSVGSSQLFIQIASIYFALNNYKLTLSYYNKSLSLCLSVKEKPLGLISLLYLNIGEVYRKTQKFDSALYYFEKAKGIDIQRGSTYLQGYINVNKGLVYAALGEINKSDSLIKLSFNTLEKIQDYRPIAETYGELAKIALKNSDLSKAYSYATKAYSIADSISSTLELKAISLLLSQINSQINNYKEAYIYLLDYNNYNQKIAGDSVVSKLAEMRAEFEISQNEAELSYLKNISKVRAILLFVALFAIIGITVLAFFVMRLSKRRKQANYQLSVFNEELTQKNEVISKHNAEKDVLMQEIHHRVKNNLQIISSIISLQSMRIKNKQTLEIFNEMQRRIMAISSIHQKLYNSESVTTINMNEYLGEIVEAINSAFNSHQLNVNYQIAVENINLNVDMAVALGLIVNELTTNAYKYAFNANNENILVLTLSLEKNNKVELSLQDNGPGMPEHFDFDKADSLGLRMVNLLIRQKKGKINIVSDHGTRFEISMICPVVEKKVVEAS
ncbi:MAG: tetratricopeptide repeat protein [Salinivirgaceae bacterium]|jgi:two-component sensor histidine kinase|nr:tetratricopeptide repeat protein [Salinivirgaceae bacterium]